MKFYICLLEFHISGHCTGHVFWNMLYCNFFSEVDEFLSCTVCLLFFQEHDCYCSLLFYQMSLHFVLLNLYFCVVRVTVTLETVQ